MSTTSHKLYIVEGADGTGKSTLCNTLMEATKGHLLHATFKPDWNIQSYHQMMYEAALQLLDYQDVILDRWAVSEEVYANAYRNGATYDADDWMRSVVGEEYLSDPRYTVLIYCSNENAVANHEENKKIRDEMFDDMSPVVKYYEKYMKETDLPWIQYDFNKVNMHEFVKELVNGA